MAVARPPLGQHLGTSRSPFMYNCQSVGLVVLEPGPHGGHFAGVHRLGQFRRDQDEQFQFVDFSFTFRNKVPK